MTKDEQIRKLEERVKELEAIVHNWRYTPGNRRNASWWHAWDESIEEVLKEHK